jgi:hypothetical protein
MQMANARILGTLVFLPAPQRIGGARLQSFASPIPSAPIAKVASFRRGGNKQTNKPRVSLADKKIDAVKAVRAEQGIEAVRNSDHSDERL